MWCQTVMLGGRVWYLVMPSALDAIYASEIWCSTCDLMCWLSQWILVVPPFLVADVKVTERRICRCFPTHAHDFILSPVILGHDTASDHECSLRLLRPLSFTVSFVFCLYAFPLLFLFHFFPLSFCLNFRSIFVLLYFCLLLFSFSFSFTFLLAFLVYLSPLLSLCSLLLSLLSPLLLLDFLSSF